MPSALSRVFYDDSKALHMDWFRGFPSAPSNPPVNRCKQVPIAFSASRPAHSDKEDLRSCTTPRRVSCPRGSTLATWDPQTGQWHLRLGQGSRTQHAAARLVSSEPAALAGVCQALPPRACRTIERARCAAQTRQDEASHAAVCGTRSAAQSRTRPEIGPGEGGFRDVA